MGGEVVENVTGKRRRWVLPLVLGALVLILIVLMIALLPESKSSINLRVIDRSGSSNPVRPNLLISIPGQPSWSPLLRARNAQHTFDGAVSNSEPLKLTIQDRGTKVLSFPIPTNSDLSNPNLRLIIWNNSYRVVGFGQAKTFERANPFLASFGASKSLYDALAADTQKAHDDYTAVFGPDNTAARSEIAPVLRDTFIPVLKSAKDKAVAPAGSAGPLLAFWDAFRICLTDSITARESELFGLENPFSQNDAAESDHFTRQRTSCDASTAAWVQLSSEADGR